MMCFYDLNSPINFRWVRLPAGIGTGAGAPPLDPYHPVFMALNKHPQCKVYVDGQPFRFLTPHMGQPEAIPVLESGYEEWGGPGNQAILVCNAPSQHSHVTALQHPRAPTQA